MKNLYTQDMLDILSKNPAYWKGMFYVNRKDPRLVVPKLESEMGWTLNFGNPYAYIPIVLFIILLTISQIILWMWF